MEMFEDPSKHMFSIKRHSLNEDIKEFNNQSVIDRLADYLYRDMVIYFFRNDEESEYWISVNEPLNGIRKDLMYIIYGYDTPQNVKAWINSQSSVLTALHYVKIAIKEREEREELRKILGWM